VKILVHDEVLFKIQFHIDWVTRDSGTYLQHMSIVL